KDSKKGDFKLIIKPAMEVPKRMYSKPSLKNIRFTKAKNIQFGLVERKKDLTKNTRLSIKPQAQTNVWIGKLSGQLLVPLKIRIPNLKLKKNEGTAYDVVSVDSKTDEVIGGFTLIVVKK
ncbi:hypothetical protein ACFL6O_02155, partial [candidate division KSB1 bacterium]